jgi:hypothetical protein
MATRSAIGYRRPDGSIRAAYCHWDGSPSHQLPILKEHYSAVRKVQALIRPGSMSSLRTETTWESTYQRDANGRADFDLPQTHLRGPQPLYHFERGEGPWSSGSGTYAMPPRTYASLAEATTEWRNSNCEWLYVYETGCGWLAYDL